MNDITQITLCNIKLFADDTSLYIEFDNPGDAADVLNQDLTKLQNWADQWLVKFCPTKTKLMTCSYKKQNAADIRFNNLPLESVNNHKHLGLVISNDLSWSSHIDSIAKSVSPLVDVLKKLKYEFDRKSLETTFYSFISPNMEYGCHIWDNCSKRDSEILENLQLDMARIVTGARKGTSHQLLYSDTNWQTLAERRELIKLKKMITITNDKAPNYLKSLLPATIGSVRPNSRHPENFFNVRARTERFRRSFIPSSVNIWNSSSVEERTVENICLAMKVKCNELYYLGERQVNIKHAQLRLECSKLNAHLYSLHVVDSPACICGNDYEDSSHFLLACPLFLDIRRNMMLILGNIIDTNSLSLDILLHGSEDYSYVVNSDIFKAVHQFIVDSRRL